MEVAEPESELKFKFLITQYLPLPPNEYFIIKWSLIESGHSNKWWTQKESVKTLGITDPKVTEKILTQISHSKPKSHIEFVDSIYNKTQGRWYILKFSLGSTVVSHHSSSIDQIEGLMDTEWTNK